MGMKKIIRFGILFLSFMTLTSCIDVVQHIGVTDDGLIQTSFRMTMQKSTMAMLEMSEEDLLEGKDEIELIEEEGVRITTSEIDNELEAGFSAEIAYPIEKQESLEGGDIVLMPIMSGKSCFINFPSAEDEAMTSEEISYMSAMFSSYKYRLIISKKLIPMIEQITLSVDDDVIEWEIIDLGDVYYLEIPVVMWMSAEQRCSLLIRYR